MMDKYDINNDSIGFSCLYIFKYFQIEFGNIRQFIILSTQINYEKRDAFRINLICNKKLSRPVRWSPQVSVGSLDLPYQIAFGPSDNWIRTPPPPVVLCTFRALSWITAPEYAAVFVIDRSPFSSGYTAV